MMSRMYKVKLEVSGGVKFSLAHITNILFLPESLIHTFIYTLIYTFVLTLVCALNNTFIRSTSPQILPKAHLRRCICKELLLP